MPAVVRAKVQARRADKRINHTASSPPQRSAIASSAASRSSASDDDDEDDDEEDDDDDDDEDLEEEEEQEEKTGFDENFLAQLMAMDPLFAKGSVGQVVNNSNNNNAAPPDVCTQVAGFVAADNASSAIGIGGALQHSTPFPNMPAYASTASTPSNEFYDGAINFLTEVLGSTDPALWDAAGSGATNETAAWSREVLPPANSAPSPAPTQAQFKSLQPLIGNLIARLKGQPVEETGPAPRVQEEDLVVLLQSLMAQRQAQSERKSVQQGGDTASARRQKRPQQHLLPPAASTPQIGEPINAQNAGLSIVDFDFGEDDDDPDFDPGRINIDFGNSDEFARALAEVTKDTQTSNGNLPMAVGDSTSNDRAWQQMLDAFNAPAATANASPGGARRTRSTSKQDEHAIGRVPMASATQKATAKTRPMEADSVEEDDEVDSSMLKDSEAGGDDPAQGSKGRKRKVYSAEEVLERRREANRECARRQRARKRQETERVRAELERMRETQSGSNISSDAIFEVTQSLISKRKRGRPLGSRNRRTIEEMERHAAQTAEDATLTDLRAENRLMCSEMHRLREENAQLRARVIRHEEFFESLGKHDLVKRLPPQVGEPSLIPEYGNGHDQRHEFSEEDGEDDVDEQVGYNDGRHRGYESRYARKQVQDPASEFLAYNPFRQAIRGGSGAHPPPPSSSRHAGRAAAPRQTRPRQGKGVETQANTDAGLWQRMSDSLYGPGGTARYAVPSRSHPANDGRANRRFDAPAKSPREAGERSLQELLRAAANDMAV